MDKKYQEALDMLQNIQPHDLVYEHDDGPGCEYSAVVDIYKCQIDTLQELIDSHETLQKENEYLKKSNLKFMELSNKCNNLMLETGKENEYEDETNTAFGYLRELCVKADKGDN